MQFITPSRYLGAIMVYILDHPPLALGMTGTQSCPEGGGCLNKAPVQYLQEQASRKRRWRAMEHLHRLWRQDEGQDIAEYAVMLAVILVIVVGTIRLIGSNANNVFSSVASTVQ
jgi:Flp pilus assembly pilin Flp